MSLETGYFCERCGEQVVDDWRDNVQLKADGDEHDLCIQCVVELKKKKFDEALSELKGKNE